VIDIEELKQWEGRRDTAVERLTPNLISRFRATLGEALLCPASVPWGIHWCLAQPAADRSDIGHDGHPKRGGFLPPVPLQRRRWAAMDIQFLQTLTIDCDMTRQSTVTEVALKQSERSGQLVFVTVEHEYLQQQDVRIRETQTLVYRQITPYEQSSKPVDEYGSTVSTCTPDSTVLFRYSALTFNAHRIHYDKPYATQHELYPALVVHGPLMATLLMHTAQQSQPDALLSSFSFRALAPAFVDEPLSLAKCNESRWEIRGPSSRRIMEASAEFSKGG